MVSHRLNVPILNKNLLSYLCTSDLLPRMGGDGTIHGIICMTDSGSDRMSLFETEFPYAGWAVPQHIRYADGRIGVHRSLRVEVQMVRYDGTPWSDWIEEHAIVMPLEDGVSRLSGGGIRQQL